MPKPFQYRAGSIIYFQGDPADKVFIVQSGLVDLVYQNFETGEDIHDKIQNGEFFGVRSTLGRFPREENAVALQDTTLLSFNINEFENLALANTRLIMQMLKVFSNHLRKVHKRISDMMELKEHTSPEDGLFSIGEYFLRHRNNKRAHYIFDRFLTYYPSSENAVMATKYMQQAEAEIEVNNTNPVPSQPQSSPALNNDSFGPEINLSAFERFARTLKAGDIIFSEYEPGNTFYLIQSGRVQLFKLIGEIEKTLDILQPSEMFGEMSILDDSPRSATAIALDTVNVLEFNKQNFEILMMGNPLIALRLLKMFCKRIYDCKRRYKIITLDEPQAKIADVFLMLDESLPLIDKTTEQRLFIITMDDVAHWAGLSINETREALNSLANKRRIEMFSDRIIVRNINDLSRYVGSIRRMSG